MEKDCGSSLHNQYSIWPSPNYLNYQINGPNQMHLNAFSVDRNSLPCIASANRSWHTAVPPLPHLRTNHAYQHDGWFNSSPCHRQALAPTSNTILTEKLSIFPSGIGKEPTSIAISGPTQKRFIIFDQSGNQTNVIFSSVNGSPTQQLNLENKEPIGSCDSNKKLLTRVDPLCNAGTIISDGLDGNSETSDKSEMREDSEELDALLYSDDDSNYDEDEDECSTGHSPCKIKEYMGHESMAGSPEEVACSLGTNKRKRHGSHDDHNDASSVMDTACSMKPNDCPEDYASDTESSCAIPRIQEKETYSSAMDKNKRLKRDRIKETVNMLQSIIPEGKGKDKDNPAVVLDEAIRYLKYLKLVAKSLGVVSL